MAEADLKVFGDEKLLWERHPVALTIGNFDGIHLGHVHVIETLKRHSAGLPLVVLTFDPHPSSLLSAASPKQPLLSLSQRVELLLAVGVDAVVVQNFSQEFSNLTPDAFVSDYLLKYFNLRCAVLGFDFCYGSRRAGDWAHFEASSKKFGFSAWQATPLIIDDAPVSSSRIRNAIQRHDFEIVERLLGRTFTLEGVVVKGDQRGRLIGFPTANLGLSNNEGTVLPYGVYAVEVTLQKGTPPLLGVMNCGVRPTIAEGLKLQIETHIIGFSGDLYGCEISFAVKRFIRSEMKFSDLESLKSQISLDVAQTCRFFGV
jgi:riboflavin kinase/FMN adenylyltransferase